MRLEDILGEREVDATCPACKHSFQTRLKELLRQGALIKCPYCMADIAIRMDGETNDEISRANKALVNLERSVRRLGGKITLG